MRNAAAPRIQIMALGNATCDTVVWRHRGELRVTVIVKATFALVPGGPMRWAETTPVLDGEKHHANLPNRSVCATSERAPFLSRADVTLVGHACAPGDVPVRSLGVRLAVLRDEVALLDKRLVARGDGEGQEPFLRVQLAYESSLGGIGSPENPFGKGFDGEVAPNLVSPDDPAQVACFAPLARRWPSRRRALGGVPARALEGPILDIPAGMDWSYFQAAPTDQRIDYLRGDEHVLLEGMHPKYTSLRTQLPSARGVARVLGPQEGAPWRPMQLVADTLTLDADKLRCAVLWRGSFPVADEAALSSLRIRAGVETMWGGVEWDFEPEMLDSVDLILEDEEDAPRTMRLSGLHTLEVPGPAEKAVVPFRKGAAASLALPSKAPGRRPPGIGDTVELVPEDVSSPRSLPFHGLDIPPMPRSRCRLL